MFTRRDFLKTTGKTAATLTTFGLPARVLAADGTPRYFLHVLLKGGVDATYLFDARPESFTTHGKLANYRTDKATYTWTDGRGSSTLTSSLVQRLESRQQAMTILNGVHMARGFDGHPQNTALAVTGSATGGRLFVTDFPRANAVPLGFVAQGRFDGAETASLEAGVTLQPKVAVRLAARFKSAAPPDENSAALRFIRDRLATRATGLGAFGRGGRQLEAGFAGATGVTERQKALALCVDGDSPCAPENRIFGDEAHAMSDGLKVAFGYFSAGLSTCALLSVNYEVDTHDAVSAKAQEQVYVQLVDDLEQLFQSLDAPVPNGDGRTFRDVTTVLVSSEFARSMRQVEHAIDDTGTDHNPFTNTVLLLGAGVRTGLIIGSTDLDQLTPDGALVVPSAAHQSLDPDLIKPMGRPLDKTTLMVRDVLPTEYRDDDYLGFLNIVNTLYRSFGVDDALHKRVSRTGPTAQVLEGLLV